jgi:hypothetical protein
METEKDKIASDNSSDVIKSTSEEEEKDNIEEPLGDKEKYFESMGKNYAYPETTDDRFQEKIYSKREFYYNRFSTRPVLDNYDNIKKFRTKICASGFSLLDHQSLLANFMAPETPYMGLLIFHGTGILPVPKKGSC